MSNHKETTDPAFLASFIARLSEFCCCWQGEKMIELGRRRQGQFLRATGLL